MGKEYENIYKYISIHMRKEYLGVVDEAGRKVKSRG